MAQVARAITQKESAEDELDGANDPLTLARARERLRGAQWELERIFHRIYGQKQELTVREEINIQFTLGAEASALLDQLRLQTVAETPIAALLPPETGSSEESSSI